MTIAIGATKFNALGNWEDDCRQMHDVHQKTIKPFLSIFESPGSFTDFLIRRVYNEQAEMCGGREQEERERSM